MDKATAIRNYLPLKEQQIVLAHNVLKPYKALINDTIRQLGANGYDLILPETSVIPLIVRPDESITGIVYGRYEWGMMASNMIIGRGVLVATEQRVLLIDKKWLFLRCDEIGYNAVSAISYSRVGPIGTVSLHTRLGDIKLRTLNQTCAKNFVESIDRCLSRKRV